MKKNRWCHLWESPDAGEAIAHVVLSVAGVTGAGVALFLGKVYAALLIAVVCFGIFLRLKRGRVKKE